MTFDEILDQAIAMLQRRGRLTYGALKRQFQLDDAYLEDLKTELIEGQRLAADEDGRVLIWTGGTQLSPESIAAAPRHQAASLAPHTEVVSPAVEARPAEAERRQLTVFFCDLVDSTVLASQLDPEDLREVVRAYQTACAEVIQRFDGYIAQYLGDGLLVYFGYPQAHEDDAQRAVRTGLGIVEALATLNCHLEQGQHVRLAVRIGIHTGLVVVGEVGSGSRQEQLAVGETPNIAARLQGLATPDTVVVSAGTYRLVQGYFLWQELGTHTLKGLTTPVQVYRLLGESAARSRLDVVGATGFTPLVGRDSEVALLLERWAQSQGGTGQVVVLRGEAGIGKSRLVEVLCEHVRNAGARRLVFRCSAYHQHSAFYPVINHLQRFLQWQRDETPETKFAKLEQALQASRLPLEEVIPLMAALLSVPLPKRYPPLRLTPQRQRQKTQEALVAWLLDVAERQPVLVVWEDLHWADPSTLDVLSLLLDQVPTAFLLALCTSRPELRLSWATHAPVTQVTLNRLGHAQVTAMLPSLTGDRTLPPEVVQQILTKTDGVPLFVEELVKMVLESGLVREQADRYILTGPIPPLAIPSTLHDSLMARLDRLSTARELAQLGAVLGREFAYELLQAVAPVDEPQLQHGLAQLVEAELLYQRGLPPHSRYLFKHALIQDAAYQSLLKSTRQHYHQRIAQVLAERFPDTAETQPELLAHHYTEAGRSTPAVTYWQQAGQRAVERSAYVEAISHLTNGLAVLKDAEDMQDRSRHELTLQITLALALHASRGQAAPEVEQAYARARELCEQAEDTPQLFRVLMGLYRFYGGRGQFWTAWDLVAHLLGLAQRTRDPELLLEAHMAQGTILEHLGELHAARSHLEQAMALYDVQRHRSHAAHYNLDPGIVSLSRLSWCLWLLGYPDQALRKSSEVLVMARELGHSHSLAMTLYQAAMFHQYRREAPAVQALAEATLTLATEQGFAQYIAGGAILRGWALTVQGQDDEGIAQL